MTRILSVSPEEEGGRRGRGGRSGRSRKLLVTLEDGMSFLLPVNQIRNLGLQEGEEIPEEKYSAIMESLYASCMRRCGLLLGSRDYPERRLGRKLEEAGYPEPVITQVMQKLEDAGYLDDDRYAAEYVRTHFRDRSRRRIEQDLLTKGIDESRIEAAFAQIEEDEDIERAQTSQICRILEKRGVFDRDVSPEDRQKALAFLYRKGYTRDQIRRAMEKNEET